VKPAAGYPLLAYSSPEAVQTTGTAAVGNLEIIKNRMRSNPTDATNMIDEAIERMSATADMHHQLHDPILFEKGLESMLREVVATVIDQSSVSLNLNVEELDLSQNQKSGDARYRGRQQLGKARLSADSRITL
jgi:hypothetical protein